MDEELDRIRREKMKGMLEKTEMERGMSSKIEVDGSNFQERVIERSKKVPVVLDFWAAWCAPCLMLGPLLEELADKYDGKFVLAKVDVNENQQLAQQYGIRAIPAVKMFKGGRVVDEFVGAMPEPLVRKWLDKNLG
ncbi:MAG: thioredoxin [Candidatus Aenigmarchaeota archaeon]|nr:thioredoxin [Candidatus Aenigmarchaeota archaeon]